MYDKTVLSHNERMTDMKFIKKIVTAVLLLAVAASLTGAALAAGYADIPADAWYASAISHVTEKGIFGGYTDGRFGPDDAITREMFVTALGRLAGVEKDSKTTNAFTDVAPDSWSAPYITWAYEHGITNGTTDTTFSPKDSITREQVAVVLDNYLTLTDTEAQNEAEDISTYADADDISAWAQDGVQAMRDHGLMSGNNAGEFKPQDSISRAEAAVVLTRLDEKLTPAAEPEEPDETQPVAEASSPSFSVEVSGYRNPLALVFRTSPGMTTELYVKTGDGGAAPVSIENIVIYPTDLSGDMSWKVTADGAIYPMFLSQHYSFYSTDSSIVSVDTEGTMAVGGAGSAEIVVTCLDDASTVNIPVHVDGAAVDTPEIDAGFASSVQAEIIRLMNAERTAAGLSPLENVLAAQQAADIRAAEFAVNASHTRPDGTMFSTVIGDIGLDGGFHAENGTTYTFAADESPEEVAKGIMDGWMNSAGHRGNILDDFHQSAVVGVHIEDGPAGSYRIYAIQLFSGYTAEKFK